MDKSVRDWAGMPAHIVELLVIKLNWFYDYVYFCGVCPQWRCIGRGANIYHKVNLDALKESCKELPMLMFRTDRRNDELRSLFNVRDEITYTIKLPLPYKFRFVGSSFGWLFCLERTMVLTLLNPCNGSCISLPVFENPSELSQNWKMCYFDFYITKGILLSDPYQNPNNFGVVVIYGDNKLAFFISGKSSWNFINSGIVFHDIIFYNGKLYGVDYRGTLVQVDLSSGTINTIIPGTDGLFSNLYVVESIDGELLMVKRGWILCEEFNNHGEDMEAEHSSKEDYNDEGDYNYDIASGSSDEEYLSPESESESEARGILNLTVHDLPKSNEFKVFKMTHLVNEGSTTWVEINSFGQQALFIGDNHSLSVSTSKFPECRSNSIYYTSQHHFDTYPYICLGLDEDSGIYSLEQKSICSHHMLGSSSKYMQPPIWFVPNPQSINKL